MMMRSSSRLFSSGRRSVATLAAMVSEQAQQSPGALAVLAPQQSVQWTYNDLNDKAKSLAFGMQELGYRPGDVLVSDLPNTVENLLLQLACSRMGVAMATIKGSTADAVADGVRALEETGAAVKGAVVADIDSPIGEVADDLLDVDTITAFTASAGPVLFDALVEAPGGSLATLASDSTAPHAYFNSVKPLRASEVVQQAQDARDSMGILASDSVCVSITLCHAFGIGSASGGALAAGAAVVLPAVGGIRGCGVPSERAAITLQVLESTKASLLFGDFHVLKNFSESNVKLPALRAGVIKIGSGTDYLHDITEATVGGHTMALEYAGVKFTAIGKRA